MIARFDAASAIDQNYLNSLFLEGCLVLRILLAEDSEVFRHALKAFLEKNAAIEIVGETASLIQTIKVARQLKPDVVLLDLHLRDSETIDPTYVSNSLRSSSRRVLTISIYDDEASRALSESYGAVKLLNKTQIALKLIPELERLASGQNEQSLQLH